LVNASLDRLPFASASFDQILLHEVLEHAADDAAVLGELRRILRPDGTLAISVPHANFPLAWDPFNRLWTAVGGRPIRCGPLVGIWTHHRRLYWPRDLVDRVTAAGFVVTQVEQATHHALPFAHFLLYGIGRRLLRHGWAAPAGRAALAPDAVGSRRVPALAVRAITATFAAADRRNDRPAVASARTFVNVLLQARKPN
jgi:SAM-dependent methyltransferase